MKRTLRFLLCMILAMQAALPITAFAAFDNTGLTWDGKATTLSDIAQKLDYDMVDANGNYKDMYYYYATGLWEKGLLLGSDGTFNLDKPITRVEGVIMTLRLLGKEQEAMNAKLPCPFTDVPTWAKYQVAYATKQGITSGYSATVFGANDPMTANQYITFVLRVMGYSDKNGDFIWSSAADKALEIGLIGVPCREQYMRSNLFLRDNVAVISYNALYSVKCKDGKMLGDTVTGVKPTGSVPYATALAKAAAEAKPEDKHKDEKPAVTGTNYAQFSVPQYESADTAAVCKTVKDESNKLFLAYSDSGYKTADYKELLVSTGFSSQGTINFEATTVSKVSGGIAYSGTQAWVCDWYAKGDIHVVFGRVGNAFIVRIYEGEVDTWSANGLRSFYQIIKS